MNKKFFESSAFHIKNNRQHTRRKRKLWVESYLSFQFHHKENLRCGNNAIKNTTRSYFHFL
jgi:hypothetical protein